MKHPVLLSWSGGKDCAYALWSLRRDERYEVVGLLTTVTEEYDRISMHGVRRSLLEAQARSLGLPLEIVPIPPQCSNERYELAMREALDRQLSRGVCAVAFGDIFLEDLRRYREEKLAQVGMEALFPLWGRDTAELSRAFIAEAFRAIITCVDTQALDGAFSGREYTEQLLLDLPAGVDPCGENGEFHSFVHDGPPFGIPVPCVVGERVLRDGRFCFCDVLPVDAAAPCGSEPQGVAGGSA